jgi:hypothetical protein
MLDTYNRVARATQAIIARTGHEPTIEELEKETGVPREKLDKVKDFYAETPFSLDRPVGDEDGRKFIDFLQEETAKFERSKWACTVWVTRSRASATAPRSTAPTSLPGIRPNHCDQGGVSSASNEAASCSTPSSAVPSNKRSTGLAPARNSDPKPLPRWGSAKV